MRRHRRHRLSRRLLVAGILLLALGLRLTDVALAPYPRATNDAGTYNHEASLVATDGDFDTGDGPNTGAGGSRGPTAYFPPAYGYLLGGVDLLDGHASGGAPALPGERIAGAALGTVAVGLIGLVALEAFGEAAALAAAALAAVYPVLIGLSGVLAAENLLVVFELAAVWAALQATRAPPGSRRWWIVGCGVLAGLAGLTHENALLMLVPLAIAVGWPPASGRRPRAGSLALLVVAAAAMLAPWTIRNAIELHHFVLVSDETGITLRGVYNPASAHFAPLHYKWRLYLSIPQDHTLARHAGRLTEVQLSGVLEHRALHYLSTHPSAVATVAWLNLRRMFELAGAYAWQSSASAQEIPLGLARAGVYSFWALCLLAIAGMGTRVARTAPRWIWGVPLLLALSVIFINVETPRFREPIDPFLLLLAGCALVAATRRAGDATACLVSAAATRLRSSRP